MITKKLFVEVINSIKEQDDIDDVFSDALETVCDSYCIYGTKNRKYNALMKLLKEIFNDVDDWIGWWLYEGVKKEITYKNGKKITIKTSEQLYDFLISK